MKKRPFAFAYFYKYFIIWPLLYKIIYRISGFLYLLLDALIIVSILYYGCMYGGLYTTIQEEGINNIFILHKYLCLKPPMLNHHIIDITVFLTVAREEILSTFFPSVGEKSTEQESYLFEILWILPIV